MIESQSHLSLEERLVATLMEKRRKGCPVAAHESSECLRKAITDELSNMLRGVHAPSDKDDREHRKGD